MRTFKDKVNPNHTSGRERSPTYNSWRAMKYRCLDSNHQQYKYYGARGVLICDRWKDNFANFLEDMGTRPEGRTLDRIDPKGNYEPSNCRWATAKTQARNKRK